MSTEEATETPRSAGQQAAALLKELVLVVVGAIVVSSVLRAFVGQMFVIPSESMENTLRTQDKVVAEKITDFERGDIVVFRDPGSWLPYPKEDPGPFDRVKEFVGLPTDSARGYLIKRVIGMPGDEVVCCDRQQRIRVNGQALDERGYLYTDPGGEQNEPSDVEFRVVVPRDRIFVLGDHRDLSADSRCHLADLSTDGRQGSTAFVPMNLVVGPAIAIATPFSRSSWLESPATFAAVPEPAAPPPAEAEIEPEGVSC